MLRSATLLLAAVTPATATAQPLQVSGWARATVPAQTASAAYLTIRNPGRSADRLLSVSTPAARSASVHSTTITDGVMRMRPLPALPVRPGGATTMRPGGVHVMLTGLKAPLRPGQRLALTLRFERAGVVRTSIPIHSAMSQPANDQHHH